MSFPIPLNVVSTITRIGVGVLSLALVSEKSAELQGLVFDSTNLGETLKVITTFWLTILPQAFYLLGLWAASSVFARLGRGDSFGPALVKGLRGVGGHLIYGALAAIVIVPTLMPMLTEHWRGFRYNLEIESVTIGLIGAVLYLLAKQGEALKSELEQFI